MAPNTSGVGFADSYKSYELASRAFQICQGVLKEGGNFVVKVFPGKEINELRADLKKAFRYVTTVVPPATRKTSSEQYFVARGFRGFTE
jgi:23S rRNA (uridine2552-2'-O)-methyltransferase